MRQQLAMIRLVISAKTVSKNQEKQNIAPWLES